jgi:hypothetical protein
MGVGFYGVSVEHHFILEGLWYFDSLLFSCTINLDYFSIRTGSVLDWALRFVPLSDCIVCYLFAASATS